jgi:hypothetical protein
MASYGCEELVILLSSRGIGIALAGGVPHGVDDWVHVSMYTIPRCILAYLYACEPRTCSPRANLLLDIRTRLSIHRDLSPPLSVTVYIIKEAL